MKSAILFSSTNYTHPDHQLVTTDRGDRIFVRAVTVDCDIAEALNQAGKFREEGETVLNTIPLPPKDEMLEVCVP